MSDKKPISEAQKRASNKYNKEHMATLGCKVTKEQAQAFKEHCKNKNSTTNKVLRDFVLDCIQETALIVQTSETTHKEQQRTPKSRVKKEMSTEQLLELTQRLKEEKSEKGAEKMQTIQEVISDTAEQEENNAN